MRGSYSTAYPWKPADWGEFLRPGGMQFGSERISFYIHIPFCVNLCRFCEYTRCKVPDENVQRAYLQTVRNDIRRFMQLCPDVTLEGFDIGGGTPTSLSAANFEYLMQIYREVVGSVNLSGDFEPSIETSFLTISPEKLRMINDAGIRRISVGVQSSHFAKDNSGIGWRYPQAREIIDMVRQIRKSGNFKLNLDFMYGFRNQGAASITETDCTAVEELSPDQVTLYELRTNQLAGYEGNDAHTRAALYATWHDMLANMGYAGRFGQNTFSRDSRDFGVSSYLRHRMLEGADYKGFGISAQSMSQGNVEYNAGKNSRDILALIPQDGNAPDVSFDATEHYELPDREKFAKFVCVSSYSGGFNRKIAKERYMPDFDEYFRELTEFLVSRGDITVDGDTISITRKGMEAYGPVFSLYYKPINSNTL